MDAGRSKPKTVLVSPYIKPATAKETPDPTALVPLAPQALGPRNLSRPFHQRIQPVTNAVGYIGAVTQEILRDKLSVLGSRLGAMIGRSPRVGMPLHHASTDMTGKVCVVTGANSGIGFATASNLAALGAEVVLVCRSEAKAQAAKAKLLEAVPKGNFTIFQGDLGTRAQARDLGARLRAEFPKIDVLINNAGILATEPGLTADNIDRSMQVNHLGPADMTLELLPSLKATGGRIVQVSSGMHHQGELQRDNDRFSITNGYADAKLHHLTFSAALAERLKDEGVTVQAAHPGAVKTNIASGKALAQRILSFGMSASSPMLRSPSQGAETVVWLAASNTTQGDLYWFDQAPAKTAAEVQDPEAQKQVWQQTLKALGRSDPFS